jgi:hypothetical protein
MFQTNALVAETELDFVVENRAGTKISHVDALSKHLGTILDKSKLRPEELRAELDKTTFADD